MDTVLNKDEIFYLLKDIKLEYKEAFFLKYYYNFTYEEIALILDIQVNSVKQKLHRARKTIHSKVGGKINGYFFKRCFKKAKRKQLLKIIITSIIVVMMLIPIIYKVGNYFAAKSSTKLHEHLFT